MPYYPSKPWQEWLVLEDDIEGGKQGYTGTMRTKSLNNNNNKRKNARIVYKVSKHIDYHINHEHIVARDMLDIAQYCPVFSKCVGKIKTHLDSYTHRPLESPDDFSMEVDCLLMEHVGSTTSLYDIIRDTSVDENVIFCTIKHILLSLAIAQQSKKFTHYDLHSKNILMRKCKYDTVFVYILDTDNQFCVPTYGYYPVIIDYGFSYSSDLDDRPLWKPLAHTDIGFTTDRFDPVADMKLFLVSVSYELRRSRPTSSMCNKIRRLVKKLFYVLDIDWGSGWNISNTDSAAEHVSKSLYKASNVKYIFFQKHCYEISDILQTLVLLPLENQSIQGYDKALNMFLKEWTCIERLIACKQSRLLVLCGIMDAVRYVRASYIDIHTRAASIRDFATYVQEAVDSVVRYCTVTSVKYENMLCALILLGQCIEGILYRYMYAYEQQRDNMYAMLSMNTVERIYAAVDANCACNYVYTTNTSLLIIDNVKEKGDIQKVKDPDYLNSLPNAVRGTSIYDDMDRI